MFARHNDLNRLAVIVAGLVIAACAPRSAPTSAAAPTAAPAVASLAPGGTPTRGGGNPRQDFDFYLVAMTLAPAFCDDGDNRRKRECQQLDRQAFARTPLTLHGMWPERLQPETYPHDCEGPVLSLGRTVRQRMQRLMPGALEHLDQHEWRKHGTCALLPPDVYFNDALDLVERANAALGQAIVASAGQRVDGETLRAAANSIRPGFGDQVVFLCHNLRGADPEKRRRPYLYEVRFCIDNDGPAGRPATALACSAVNRRDQGCGRSFWIDGR
jgi:ribonuclease T2